MYNLDSAAIRPRVQQLIREQPSPTQRGLAARTGLQESLISKLQRTEPSHGVTGLCCKQHTQAS